jgi:hypothetical protein
MTGYAYWKPEPEIEIKPDISIVTPSGNCVSKTIDPGIGVSSVNQPVPAKSPLVGSPRFDRAFLQQSAIDAILTSPGTVHVVRSELGRILFMDLARMLSVFHQHSFATGLWLASRSAFPALATMQDTVGRNICQQLGASFLALMGFPLLVTPRLNNVGEKGDVLLIDSDYLLVHTPEAIQQVKTTVLADETTYVSPLVMLH